MLFCLHTCFGSTQGVLDAAAAAATGWEGQEHDDSFEMCLPSEDALAPPLFAPPSPPQQQPHLAPPGLAMAQEEPMGRAGYVGAGVVGARAAQYVGGPVGVAGAQQVQQQQQTLQQTQGRQAVQLNVVLATQQQQQQQLVGAANPGSMGAGVLNSAVVHASAMAGADHATQLLLARLAAGGGSSGSSAGSGGSSAGGNGSSGLLGGTAAAARQISAGLIHVLGAGSGDGGSAQYFGTSPGAGMGRGGGSLGAQLPLGAAAPAAVAGMTRGDAMHGLYPAAGTAAAAGMPMGGGTGGGGAGVQVAAASGGTSGGGASTVAAQAQVRPRSVVAGGALDAAGRGDSPAREAAHGTKPSMARDHAGAPGSACSGAAEETMSVSDRDAVSVASGGASSAPVALAPVRGVPDYSTPPRLPLSSAETAGGGAGSGGGTAFGAAARQGAGSGQSCGGCGSLGAPTQPPTLVTARSSAPQAVVADHAGLTEGFPVPAGVDRGPRSAMGADTHSPSRSVLGQWLEAKSRTGLGVAGVAAGAGEAGGAARGGAAGTGRSAAQGLWGEAT